MSQPRRGLGKGLGSLIPTAPAQPASPSTADSGRSDGVPQPQPVAGAHFAEVPISEITPNRRQPRETFDEAALEELAASIRIVGLLQPVVVRELGPNRYELIMGERRLRASKMAELEKIPAIVRDTGDDDMLRDALMENLHRQQLNALEEAAAYRQLLDDFGATHEELAVRIGRSRPHITNTLRLLNLPPVVQRRVAAGVLSAGHARALLSLESAEQQEYLAKRIVEEGLSVRAVEELITLGEVGETKKAARQKAPNRPENPRIRELASELSELYETKVRVDLGQRKGKIVVEFATLEDLERIVDAMTPDSRPRA
ncbi:ParB/RepB/Spo0J family partition protein [Actinoallomurus rhizosphaericola]|uniref:ParB/RepB/Spo0J family partition protein n=1 Tax=Actinoallomurus rhizosphaericola TaxID=2952536 RepID=UPI0020927F9C|nr:ParB/RepB/Spo0J family partition protein [Actinoallomurus rhizosphaericola]MCO5995109.1 ParB/RepB/Spo0J family partition protein [Actinoallomurus rhizosphaericola]